MWHGAWNTAPGSRTEGSEPMSTNSTTTQNGTAPDSTETGGAQEITQAQIDALNHPPAAAGDDLSEPDVLFEGDSESGECTDE